MWPNHHVDRGASHCALAFGDDDPLLIPHPDYPYLAGDPATRQQAYRRVEIDDADVDSICRHLQQHHTYGPDGFRKTIDAPLGRSREPLKMARPTK